MRGGWKVRRPGPLVLAGGGTAGHLLPGFALAEALEAHGVVTYLLTPASEANRPWLSPHLPTRFVPVPRWGRTGREHLAFVLSLPRSILASAAHVRRLRAGCIVALGGWPSFPPAVAALLLGRPLVLWAGDDVPGKVVQVLAPVADRVYVARPEAAQGLGPSAVVTGPLVSAQRLLATADAGKFGLRAGLRTLLVVGGSLGAQNMNTLLAEGLAAALRERPDLRDSLQVLQAAGPEAGRLQSRYRAIGLRSAVFPFIHDMGSAYAAAHLFLGRAGAGTVAELEALGLPAVLVPYPHHADRQQHRNAARLVATGQAQLIEEGDLTPHRVQEAVLDRLLALPPRTPPAPPSASAAATARDLIRSLGWDRPARVPVGHGPEDRRPTGERSL